MKPEKNTSRKLYRNFLLFSAAVRTATCAETISQEMDINVTDAQADALRFLYLNEHVCMGKIAIGLGYTTSGATKAINRLEEKGWVVRHACPDDHREIDVSLTPQGREIATKITEISERRVNDLISAIPEQTLVRLDKSIDEFFREITLDEEMSHRLCVACGYEGGFDCTSSAVDCVVADAQRCASANAE
ncbi:MAG: MarR family transcriptional regulator [bacterium]